MNQEKYLECAAYFKNKKGFHRLLKGFREKYRSLGHIGGSVKLDNLTEDEKEAFEGFFLKSYRKQKSAVISSGRMEQALHNSRFGDLDLYNLLLVYFNGPIESKEQEKKKLEEKRNTFWNRALKKYENTFSGNWLEHVLHKKGNTYRYLTQRYREQSEEFYSILDCVMKAGNELPVLREEKERLAVFATRITKNPHFFDEGREGNYLLSSIIRYYLEQGNNTLEKEGKYKAETKNELFYSGGIIKEDILNYTNAYGIRLVKGNGGFHQGAEGFYREKQPVQLSLLALSNIQQVYTNGNKLYIIENSGVFSELIERAANEVPFVCTNGQLHLASLVLLDLFYRQNYSLYYCGDFDPEGLQIAQKLKRRYKEKLRLWHYSIEDYQKAMSDVRLTTARIKKLDVLEDIELCQIGELIRSTNKAGYQERLIEDYITDINRLNPRL